MSRLWNPIFLRQARMGACQNCGPPPFLGSFLSVPTFPTTRAGSPKSRRIHGNLSRGEAGGRGELPGDPRRSGGTAARPLRSRQGAEPRSRRAARLRTPHRWSDLSPVAFISLRFSGEGGFGGFAVCEVFAYPQAIPPGSQLAQHPMVKVPTVPKSSRVVLS